MKKSLLILLIALMCTAVFAFDMGKIAVGSKIGYLPQFKMAQFDATAKWQMDAKEHPEFTTDLVVEAGLITDFKKSFTFDGFLGAGFTFAIADKWDVYGNCGLDALASKEYFELGVAANVGCEYNVWDNLVINANFKVAEYMQTRNIIYKPSIGATYVF